MTLTDYVSFEEVRAALGVSEDEIKDATLSLDLYAFNLVSELEGISLTLVEDYAQQKVSPVEGWTPIQVRFHQAVRLFSAYAVAKQATISVPMFAPKEQTDGKASLGRWAQDPYKPMIASVLKQYEVFKVKLEAAYGAIQTTVSPTTVDRPYMSVVAPISDPVLGT
jgi:hypothetical protein